MVNLLIIFKPKKCNFFEVMNSSSQVIEIGIWYKVELIQKKEGGEV